MAFRGHKPKFHHNSVKDPTLISRSVFRIGIKARFFLILDTILSQFILIRKKNVSDTVCTS